MNNVKHTCTISKKQRKLKQNKTELFVIAISEQQPTLAPIYFQLIITYCPIKTKLTTNKDYNIDLNN